MDLINDYHSDPKLTGQYPSAVSQSGDAQTHHKHATHRDHNFLVEITLVLSWWHLNRYHRQTGAAGCLIEAGTVVSNEFLYCLRFAHPGTAEYQ